MASQTRQYSLHQMLQTIMKIPFHIRWVTDETKIVLQDESGIRRAGNRNLSDRRMATIRTCESIHGPYNQTKR